VRPWAGAAKRTGTLKSFTLVVASIVLSASSTSADAPQRPLARETLKIAFADAWFPDSGSVVIPVQVTNIGASPIQLPKQLHLYARFTTRAGKTTRIKHPDGYLVESTLRNWRSVDRGLDTLPTVRLEPGDTYTQWMSFNASRGDAIRMDLALPAERQSSLVPRGSFVSEWYVLVGFRLPTW